MTTTVNVPDVGLLQFQDGMSEADMSAALPGDVVARFPSLDLWQGAFRSSFTEFKFNLERAVEEALQAQKTMPGSNL